MTMLISVLTFSIIGGFLGFGIAMYFDKYVNNNLNNNSLANSFSRSLEDQRKQNRESGLWTTTYSIKVDKSNQISDNFEGSLE